MQTIYMPRLRRLLADCEGATAIEYGLIVALIGIAIMTTLQGLGNEVSNTFTGVKGTMTTANAAAA